MHDAAFLLCMCQAADQTADDDHHMNEPHLSVGVDLPRILTRGIGSGIGLPRIVHPWPVASASASASAWPASSPAATIPPNPTCVGIEVGPLSIRVMDVWGEGRCLWRG